MWTEGIAVVFADTLTANVISWWLGRCLQSADSISASVCGPFDKVGQENPLLCPRLQHSPGHWCWWHQINTWLTAEYHHRSFSISLFHVQTYSTHTYSMCTHADRGMVVCGSVYVDVILQAFSAACLSSLRRWERRKLVRSFKSCPRADRRDSRITCTMTHSYLHILCSSARSSNSSCLQPWNSNSWWTLADWRVGLQPGLLTSEAWQKCPFTYTNYEGKIDGEASQNASCYFSLIFLPQLRLW